MRILLFSLFLCGVLPAFSQNSDDLSGSLKALGARHTVEATRALIKLANGPDPRQSLAAARILTLRLPATPVNGDFGLYDNGFDSYGAEQRNLLAQQSWDSSLIEPVHILMRKFLTRPEPEAIHCGALMMQAVGKKEDAPLLFKILDEALADTFIPRRGPREYSVDYPTPLRELIWAVRVLQSRGYASSHPSGPAQTLGYMLSLRRTASIPMAVLKASVASPYYPLRQIALESLFVPLPDNDVPFVQRGMADRDSGVCRTACAIAEKSGRKDFLRPILDIIATDDEELLLGEAGGAACNLGGEFEALPIWADRLPTIPDIAFNHLLNVLKGLPQESEETGDLSRRELLELKTAWVKFISAHADELRRGKKFAYTDPAVSPELIGRKRRWHLPGGHVWPPDGDLSR